MEDWIIKANQAMDYLFMRLQFERNPTKVANLIHMARRLEQMINHAVKERFK